MAYGMRIRSLSGVNTSIKQVDGDFDKVTSLPDSDGLKADPTHMPKQVKWLDGNGAPPGDFDRTIWTNVSERAKAAIEELESGVHQFIPVEFLNQRGKHLEHRFWFNTGNRIDGMDRENTTMVLVLNSWSPAKMIATTFPDFFPEGADPNAEPKMVFNRDQIDGVHLWHDRYLSGGKGMAPFMSQAMHDHLKAKGMTGIVYDTGEVEVVG